MAAKIVEFDATAIGCNSSSSSNCMDIVDLAPTLTYQQLRPHEQIELNAERTTTYARYCA
jgi:hypothetical protein